MIQANRANVQFIQPPKPLFNGFFQCCSGQTQQQIVPYLINDRKKDGKTVNYNLGQYQSLNYPTKQTSHIKDDSQKILKISSPVNNVNYPLIIQSRESKSKIQSQSKMKKTISSESNLLLTRNQNTKISNRIPKSSSNSQVGTNMIKSTISEQDPPNMQASVTYNITANSRIHVDKAQLQQFAIMIFQQGYNLGLKNGQTITQNSMNQKIKQLSQVNVIANQFNSNTPKRDLTPNTPKSKPPLVPRYPNNIPQNYNKLLNTPVNRTPSRNTSSHKILPRHASPMNFPRYV